MTSWAPLTAEEQTHPAAERYVRDHQWDALEELLSLIPPGGTYEEVIYLPRRLAARAVRCAFFLGWVER